MRLTINGIDHVTEAVASSKAMYVLRNDLGFHDVRQGCGEGHCGACTVLVDGQPTTTCDLQLWALEGKAVTTLRGLGSAESPHPVQTAFLQEQAGQCGYCLSGILMTASTLVSRSPRPTEAQVRAALDRHLCRCGTHHRIIKAVLRALDATSPILQEEQE